MTKAIHEVRLCDKHGEVDFYFAIDPSRRGGGRFKCMVCHREKMRAYARDHPDAIRSAKDKYREKLPHMQDRPDCSLYLGVYVAERVLSLVFKDVKRMPINNSGYDFICNNGHKIDVKSSCLHRRGKFGIWDFAIRRNEIADYFLCLGFDNRESLTPLHVWLIPSGMINYKKELFITNTATGTSQWLKYEKPIEPIKGCCDRIRGIA